MSEEKDKQKEIEKEELSKERDTLLEQIEGLLEFPMIILGIVWLILTIIDLTKGLNPTLSTINNVVWGIFIVDFLLKFIIAPKKIPFLKNNVISMISLAVPALRVLRIARALRLVNMLKFGRGFSLVRIFGTVNRGMRTLSKTMERRAFGFVFMLTIIVWLIGGAGMYAFEKDQPHGLNTIGYSLWWTAMLLTQIASDYWPRTPEGRILCFVVGVYGFAVLGYFTASLATIFLGLDAKSDDSDIASDKHLKQLNEEVQQLRSEVRDLLQVLNNKNKPE